MQLKTRKQQNMIINRTYKAIWLPKNIILNRYNQDKELSMHIFDILFYHIVKIMAFSVAENMTLAS